MKSQNVNASLFFLLILLVVAAQARLLGHKMDHEKHKVKHAHEPQQLGDSNHVPQKQKHLNKPDKAGHKKKHKHDGVDPQTTSTATTSSSQENETGKPEEEDKKPDCGSFFFKQEEGLVFYDNYEEIDVTQETQDELVCKSVGNDEMCFDMGNETAALYVEGKCSRGMGTTKVSFTRLAGETPSFLLFACRGSARATPKVVKCRCNYLDADRRTQFCDPKKDLPFRAEARFGNVTMPSGVSAECTLACKMPTTDE